MNIKLLLIIWVSFLSSDVLHAMAHNTPHVKPTQASLPEESEPVARVLHPNQFIANYGEEVSRLQAVIAQALAVVQSNETSQDTYVATLAIHTQKIGKLTSDMEPRKNSLAQAQQLTTPMAPTLIAGRKALLHDGLLATIAALNDVIALQDSRIQALMKNNEQIKAILTSKS